MEVVQNNKNRRSLQHTYELAELFFSDTALFGNEAFYGNYPRRRIRVALKLITDALMMNDLEDIKKRVHNLPNYLMVKSELRIAQKVAEA